MTGLEHTAFASLVHVSTEDGHLLFHILPHIIAFGQVTALDGINGSYLTILVHASILFVFLTFFSLELLRKLEGGH